MTSGFYIDSLSILSAHSSSKSGKRRGLTLDSGTGFWFFVFYL
ncbi:hypothetical protein VL20_4976 [Microcystis panniformis FACHB-1757]|uniref:Uncharacterized protein n=1 Tax=Microcystis panniformis FACHB-1757 TaxID=1638788 RepID=A0A0K1S753_9CHRO|nr:hypothetical protein VL20_4976 [Microcystis panniformis FACHB-1757]